MNHLRAVPSPLDPPAAAPQAQADASHSINPSITRQARRLVLAVIVGLGLPALLLGAWLTYQSASQAVQYSMASRVPLMAQLVENDMASKLQALSHAAQLLQVHQVTDITQQQLDSIVSGFSGVAWAGVANVGGQVVRAHQNLLLEANVSKRPWFNSGMQKPSVLDRHDALLLAKLLPQRVQPYQFIDMAVPLVSTSGQVIGVLALHLDWMWFEAQFPTLVGQTDQNSTTDLLVYGRDGTLRLTHFTGEPPSNWPTDLKSDQLADKLQGEYYMVKYPAPTGSTLEALGWTL